MQDQFLACLTDLATLVFLAVLGHHLDGHKTFLDLLLRIEDGANDELERLRSAQRAEVRPDLAALAIDRMTGNTTQLRPSEYFRAHSRISTSAYVIGEVRDLRGRHVLRADFHARGVGKHTGQSIVAAPAGTH